MPGESASVVTCLDGYQLARQGRAGAALGIAAIASFVAGTAGVLALMLIAPPVAKFALSFSSPEYFALMALGLALVSLLAGQSFLKALLAMLVGLWIASMGVDLFSSQSRFTFGQMELLDGIDFVVVAIGVFAVGEVLATVESPEDAQTLPVPKGWRNLLPTKQDLKDCRFAFVNGSVVGFIIGVLPGAGSTIASFISYGIEKSVSKHPEKFGTGVIEGVAAPEGANNAETGGALVPLLTLGIPGSGTTAILLAALVLWGFKPGPLLIQDNPGLFWGLVASMYVGNVMLLVLNLPLVPVFAQILRVPPFALMPGDSRRVPRRRVGGERQLVRWRPDGRFRHSRLRDAQARLSRSAADPRHRARRQYGTRAAPVVDDVAGDLSILVSRPISAAMLCFAAIILLAPLVKRFNRWRAQTIESDA